MYDDMKEYEIFNSLDVYIQRDLKNNENRLKRSKDNLDHPQNGKLGFMEKRELKHAVKYYSEKVMKIRQIQQNLYRAKGIHDNTQFSDKLKERLEEIGSHLDAADVSALQSSINSAVKNCNKEQKQDVEKYLKEAEQLLKSVGLDHKSVSMINEFGNMIPGTSENILAVLSKARKVKEQSLTPARVSLNINKEENKVSFEMESTLQQIKEMAQKKQLDDNKMTKSIVENLSKIQTSFEQKAKAHQLNTLITTTLNGLKQETSMDLSQVEQMLQQIYKKNQRTIDEANKYLDKFDFKVIEEQARKQREKEQKEATQKAILQEYKSLALEHERVKQEHRGDAHMLMEIEEKMRKVADNARLHDINDRALRDAGIEGKDQYREQKKKQEVFAEAAQKEIISKHEMMAGIETHLRERAIRELEATGALDGVNYAKNGDVYNTMTLDQRESLIRAKMDEMKNIAKMTPEERGLEALKKSGRLPATATLSDLTPQQLADFRYVYRDEIYADIKKEVKDIEIEEKYQTKKQATTIYKEYIRYFASQPDKSQALKFSEYAAIQYGYDNMDLSMVDEEVKGRSM